MVKKKNPRTVTLGAVIAVIIGMFCLAYASVPLYSLFCKVTGFGGTTQKAATGSTVKGKKEIAVQFDANIEQGLDWVFKPMQREVKVRTGENALIFFYAENKSDEPITGMATFNVTPDKTGIYFNKIQCFCFNQQTLKPHEKVTMPVTFFIDPAIESDPTTEEVTTITLSYSFFKVKNKDKATKGRN